ncbi:MULTISPECIES: YIP1 family protein [Chryseobacterium]|uniref:YIP1 family protein n=1 Tax=Chryseobacterium TaxID=59732 RepID=UPI0012948A42|nr:MULTISPECIES: YIP1 family protein [Chryseobacterium]MDR6919331.1 uncharacterized membrane protein YidH (DUF202 family) [Chryseobacterium sp. 2987]
MNWKTIFNPFERFDDKQILVAGILTVVAAILTGYWTDSFFSSIYKINSLEKTSLQAVAIPTLTSFALAILILFILGKILNGKTRFIDIVNTVLISQMALVVLQAVSQIPYIDKAQEHMISYQTNPTGAFPVFDFIVMMSMASFVIAVLIYSITVYYNGFKTATNLKKWQHIVLFGVVSLIMIIVCQILTAKYL